MIQPTNPQVVYVPYYDPMVVYGPWWWPAYPPVYWGPWPGYYIGSGFGAGFAWGVGITLGVGFFFGAFDWPHRHVNVFNVNNYYYRGVNVNPGNVWAHDPVHRRGVPYRTESLRQEFGRTSTLSETRRDFRGHDSFEGRGGFGNRSAQGGLSSRPSPSGLGSRPNVGNARSRSQESGMNRSDMRSPPSRPRPPSGMSRPSMEPRPHAFEGVGHGPDVRNFSARGNSSFQGFAPRPSGTGHGGGGGGHSHR